MIKGIGLMDMLWKTENSLDFKLNTCPELPKQDSTPLILLKLASELTVKRARLHSLKNTNTMYNWVNFNQLCTSVKKL